MKKRNVILVFCMMLTLWLLTSCNGKQTKRRSIVVLTEFEENSLPFMQLRQCMNEEFDSTSYTVTLLTGVEAFGEEAPRSIDTPTPRHIDTSTHQSIDNSNHRHIDPSTTRPIDTSTQRPSGPATLPQPDLILIYGDKTAQEAAASTHPLLRNTPTICFNISHPGWKGILTSRRNCVVMESPLSLRENLRFISDLHFPKWVVTSIDSTYIDEHLREHIQQCLGGDTMRYTVKAHPLPSDIFDFDSRDKSQTVLIPISLQHPELCLTDTVHGTEIDLHDFMQMKENRLTFLRMKMDNWVNLSLRYNISLYFSATPEVYDLPLISALNGCVGGYLTPLSEMVTQVHPLVDQILDGAKPETFPLLKHKPDYWMDWRLAKLIHPYAEDFPPYVRFTHLPWKFTSRLHEMCYEALIPISITLFLVFVFIVPITLTVRSIRQRLRILKQGRAARQLETQIEDTLATINAYHFTFNKNMEMELHDNLYDMLRLRHRPLPLEVVLKCVDQPKRDELRKALLNTSDSANVRTEVMARIFRNGRKHALLLHISKLKDMGADQLWSGIIILNDEAYKAEEERKEAFRRSEEVTAKESFLAAMGHEIRNPLNAIVGFANVLLEHNNDLSDEERVTCGDYIMQSKDHMLKLINNVMEFSREKGDKIQVELSQYNIGKLMEDIYMTHSVVVPKHIAFGYHRGPQDIEVNVNRTSINQVISNLMNNAIKFTEKGEINIGWERVHEEVVIYVEDTGIGIAPEQQDHIFERYYKENNQTVGAGIGLSLCKDLIAHMNGTITVKSTLGEGSRFEVRLPIVSV